MARLLEPRACKPNAWIGWCKTGAKLARRAAPAVLPQLLLMALVLGTVARHPLGLLALLVLSGFWQAATLTVLEKAAAGERPDLWTWLGAFARFAQDRSSQAWRQVKVRFVVTLVLLAFFMLLSALAKTVIAGAPPSPTPPAPLPAWLAVLQHPAWLALAGWCIVWLGSWVFQKQGVTSMTNMLVRRHDLTWPQADALCDRARDLNKVSMLSMVAPFMILQFLLVVLPVLIPLVELLWSAMVTVMARDIFEQEPDLAPVLAPVAVGNLVQA